MPESAVLPDDELGRALVRAAPFVAYPDGPDLAGLVARRLREEPPVAGRAPIGVSLRMRRALRPVLRPALQPVLARAAVAVFVGLALLAGTMVFSPAVRHAVAGWLGLRGVRIEVTQSPPPSPGSLGRGLDLGQRMTLAEAQARVSYRILVPAQLGPPDEVYVDSIGATDRVTLLYRARPGLPKASLTGAGLLLTEFQATIDADLIKKVSSQATVFEPVTVNGGPGYWIGGIHEVLLLDPNGVPVPDSIRLAGNVLLWEQGDLTLRIEADISEAQALAVADSVG